MMASAITVKSTLVTVSTCFGNVVGRRAQEATHGTSMVMQFGQTVDVARISHPDCPLVPKDMQEGMIEKKTTESGRQSIVLPTTAGATIARQKSAVASNSFAKSVAPRALRAILGTTAATAFGSITVAVLILPLRLAGTTSMTATMTAMIAARALASAPSDPSVPTYSSTSACMFQRRLTRPATHRTPVR